MHQESNLTLSKSRSSSALIHYLFKPCRAHIPKASYQVSRSLAFWLGEENIYIYIYSVFTLYGQGGHLGHVIINICNELGSKFDLDVK